MKLKFQNPCGKSVEQMVDCLNRMLNEGSTGHTSGSDIIRRYADIKEMHSQSR